MLERRSLLRRLARAVDEFPFTLVCAPAGYGKTVLAADWAGRPGGDRPIAWLTMTERDEQPGVFWAHLRLALSMVGVLAADSLQPLFPDAADIDALADDLLRLALPVVLVIDAAERLPGRVVADRLARLLDGAGDRLRVLMTSRTEPPLPLHRYRVEGRIAEIRADDLVLSRKEVAKLLAQHRLTPSAELTDRVLRRTEGWPAGVRLAALRIRSFGASAPLDGFADDYLRAEVLDELAPADQDLLARTSVVDELPPGLAPALTDRPDADDRLRRLASGNGFVQQTRDRPDVFRVHPLVRELVGSELDRAEPGTSADLHRRAAAWFGAEDRLEPAVRHAAAAHDWERAATLVVEGQGLGEVVAGTAAGAALVGHLAPMPDSDAVDVRLLRAALAVGDGDLDRAGTDLEQGTAEADDGPRTLVAAVVRTALHDAAGRPAQTLEAAREARARLGGPGSGTDLLTATVVTAEGAAQLRAGDLDAACTALGEALLAAAGAAGRLRLRCLAELALAEACRGHLSRALSLVDAAEREAADQTVPAAARPMATELARAWVALERQDLPQTQRSLDRIRRWPAEQRDEWSATVASLLRVRLMRDRGEGSSARRLLEQSEPPAGWLREQVVAESTAVGLPEQPPAREIPARPEASAERSRSVIPAARVGELLERADERCRAGRTAAARADVARALAMAHPERLRRPFAHTSPRIRALVRGDPGLYAKAGWLRPEQLGGHAHPASVAAPEPAPEALSERELEVLRHLSALLTTDEIAAELFISVNTVRTHVRRILEKLSVSRRNEAVRRGRELGLV